MKCPTPSRFACHPSSEGNTELNVSCMQYDYYSPHAEGCPKGGVSSSDTLIKCSSSEAETKTRVNINAPHPSAALGVHMTPLKNCSSSEAETKTLVNINAPHPSAALGVHMTPLKNCSSSEAETKTQVCIATPRLRSGCNCITR